MSWRGPISWRMGVRRGDYLIDHALWTRAAERIEPPPHRLVPGPLDLDTEPPVPSRTADEVPDDVLGEEWLGWWLSLVDPLRQPIRPTEGLEPAFDTPDPLGLAPYPALRRIVARRWREASAWHVARQRTHATRPPSGPASRDVVHTVERSLGRPLRPFSVEFILLPVRDEVIRRVGEECYLVPERVHDSPRWAVWLRSLVLRIG